MTERKYALLLLSLFVLTVSLIGCTPTLEKSENKKKPVRPSRLAELNMILVGADFAGAHGVRVLNNFGYCQVKKYLGDLFEVGPSSQAETPEGQEKI
jgi:hypothetical protein